MRAARAVAEVQLLQEHAVGDDLVVGGRRDDELARRLVVRMIDHGQPVARAVRPVQAEEGAVPVLVRADPQPGRGYAAVADRERAPLSRTRGSVERDAQPVGRMREAECRAARGDCGHRHALSIRDGSEVELERLEAIGHEPHVHPRVADDLVRRIGEHEVEGVVLDVDARLALIRIGGRPGVGREREQQAEGGVGADHRGAPVRVAGCGTS